MFEKSILMWIYSEHPVHAGSGSGVGAIDLPIQRERVTGWPIIQPSGLKGALREHFERFARGPRGLGTDLEGRVKEVFGPDDDATHAGAASFMEAKVLLFPVRSLKGTFGYVTCPLALKRLHRDLSTLATCTGNNLLEPAGDRPTFPSLPDETLDVDGVWVSAADDDPTKPDCLLLAGNLGDAPRVVFEELAFQAKAQAEVKTLAKWLLCAAPSLPWLDRDNLARRLALVSDDAFKDFVEMSTEVVTRNRIDNGTGTVMEGALWTEEHLPRETVLYSAVFATKPFKSPSVLTDAQGVIDFFSTGDQAPTYIWVGGNTTVGKGLVRLAFA